MPRWIWLTGMVSGRDVAPPARADLRPRGSDASRPTAASARNEERWRKGEESTIKAPPGQGRFCTAFAGETTAQHGSTAAGRECSEKAAMVAAAWTTCCSA